MIQIINMFFAVVIFWLIIEVIYYRVTGSRKTVKIIDEINPEQ